MAGKEKKMTPMMQQYFALKKDHDDCLLFFRLGDFYEMFFDDAQTAAKELDLTLTTRDRNKPPEERTPMCGVPYHAADAYIARLIAKGYKVAICEQTENPAEAKGIVKRDVVRIVTPGTVLDAAMLDDGENNFIASLWVGEDGAGLAIGDISTGELFLSAFPLEHWEEDAMNQLEGNRPKEILLSPLSATPTMLSYVDSCQGCRYEMLSLGYFGEKGYAALEENGVEESLSQLDEKSRMAIPAVGALYAYMNDTQKTKLNHMKAVKPLGEDYMTLDVSTRRNLELTETLRGKEKKGSLLWVLDKTKTAMGGRMIRAWLERPLLDINAIKERLDGVEVLVGNFMGREELRRSLKEVGDLERLIGRIVYGSAGGRDLVALRQGLGQMQGLRTMLEDMPSKLLQEMKTAMTDLPELCDLIDRSMADEMPFSVREGGVIRDGYHPLVDELRGLLKNSRSIVADIEGREKEKTGIKTLKISYNKVFGYYIEVSKSYYDMVPEDYIRKQTLANCERYITQELKEMEHKILSADDRITGLEYELFCEIRDKVAKEVEKIQEIAAAVATVDVLASFATVASGERYCKPVVDEGKALIIDAGRHPVVEQMQTDTYFVPNDTEMDGESHRLSLITGPNMAGKSTYMRQVALISIMAQIGSFVPAKSAHIGMIDRVFTRIGASDDLAGGQSTFMVEMSEVADILRNATEKSLLLLDEIGRGTSTYDGMAIARGVLEWCVSSEHLGAKTLFATHYHELTALEEKLSGVKNFNIAAKKREDDIIFLRKIVPGAADQSYGIEVAQLAGVPLPLVQRSKEFLAELESGEGMLTRENIPSTKTEVKPGEGKTSGEMVALEKLNKVSVDTMTPLEAMHFIYELKGYLKEN